MQLSLNDKKTWGKFLFHLASQPAAESVVEDGFPTIKRSISKSEIEDIQKLKKHVYGLIQQFSQRQSTANNVSRLKKMYSILITIDGVMKHHKLDISSKQ